MLIEMSSLPPALPAARALGDLDRALARMAAARRLGYHDAESTAQAEIAAQAAMYLVRVARTPTDLQRSLGVLRSFVERHMHRPHPPCVDALRDCVMEHDHTRWQRLVEAWKNPHLAAEDLAETMHMAEASPLPHVRQEATQMLSAAGISLSLLL